VQNQNALSAGATVPLLADVSGFGDRLGFIALFRLFPAHITGNVVLLAFSAGTLCGAIGHLTISFLTLIAPILAALTLGLLARPHPETVV